jgi:hypothetical protein
MSHHDIRTKVRLTAPTPFPGRTRALACGYRRLADGISFVRLARRQPLHAGRVRSPDRMTSTK